MEFLLCHFKVLMAEDSLVLLCAFHCSIAATFFTFEYVMKLIVCPNKKRWGRVSSCFRERLRKPNFPAFFWIRWTWWTLWPLSPSSCPPSSQVTYTPPADKIWQLCRNDCSQGFKACRWSTRLATWSAWFVVPLSYILMLKFPNRSGFCGSSVSSRWSGTSLAFKASSTRFTRPGKNWASSSSLSALSFSCSPASSMLLNKTDQMHTNGEANNCPKTD